MELIRNPKVQAYMRSARYRNSERPVETAMCDNFKGWGNFSDNALGIESNICLPHATGKSFTITLCSSKSNFFVPQELPLITIRMSSTFQTRRLMTTFIILWSTSVILV